MLLIAPQYFGYQHAIAEGLVACGHEVDFLPDRPFNNSLIKALMRFRPELGFHQACDIFFAQRLDELGRNNFSTILVIQGEGVTAKTLKNLRNLYPTSRLVFYTWDSIDNKPFFRRNLSLYDKCSTFDPVDAKRYGMFFRPLFYSEGFDRPGDLVFTYDLSFIGTLHSDRYRIVSTLIKQLQPESRAFVYLYIQAHWMYYLRRIFTNTVDGTNRCEFRFEPLSKDEVLKTFFSSRAIIDIEHVKQRGATMRTIEALGSRRKLVTTNASLQDYDFYNPNNIQIIDRKGPILQQDFLTGPYQELPESIMQKYSLRRWINDLCGTKE